MEMSALYGVFVGEGIGIRFSLLGCAEKRPAHRCWLMAAVNWLVQYH